MTANGGEERTKTIEGLGTAAQFYLCSAPLAIDTWLAGTRVMSRVLQWEQCQGCGWGEQAAGGVLVKVETTPLINPAPAQPISLS